MTGYNSKVCLGNWYEDRVQSESNSNSTNTNSKIRPNKVILDYGYREYETDALSTWGIDPTRKKNNNSAGRVSRVENILNLHKQNNGVFNMTQSSTYEESTINRVSTIRPEKGFNSILPVASKENENVSYLSNSQYSYGVPERQSHSQQRSLRRPDAPSAGVDKGVRFDIDGDYKRRAIITKCSSVRGSSNRVGENVWMDCLGR